LNFELFQLKKTNHNDVKVYHDYDDHDNDVDAKIGVSQEEESVKCVEFGVVYRSRASDIVGSVLRWPIL
jgi:hypothetical protein